MASGVPDANFFAVNLTNNPLEIIAEMSKDKQLVVGLVDDDKLYRFTASLLLQSTKQVEKIIQFEDGKDAIEFLSENAANVELLPDVIFLDINMQFMDGWTFLEEYEHIVQKMKKQIVIFMVSSSMDPEEIQRAKQNPLLSEYVIKPVTKFQFDDIIAKAKKEIETIQLSA